MKTAFGRAVPAEPCLTREDDGGGAVPAQLLLNLAAVAHQTHPLSSSSTSNISEACAGVQCVGRANMVEPWSVSGAASPMHHGASCLLPFAWRGCMRCGFLFGACLGLLEPVRLAFNGQAGVTLRGASQNLD